MPSDKNAPPPAETNSETMELLQKIKSDYPKAPDPAKVWNQSCRNNFKRELDNYNNGDETRGKIPRYFNEIGPLKYQNFVKHVLKNLRQLENVGNSIYIDHERKICDKLYSEFEEETDLKSCIEKDIAALPSFENSSSDWNQKTKSRREFLMRNETEVQAILKPSSSSIDELIPEKVKVEGYPLNDLWKDKWHPINLTLSYGMFRRFVNLIILQRQTPLKEFIEDKGQENAYKRHYLRHMFKAAESNQEFLLAVITFGTDARFYPSRVMEFFRARDMLKDKYNSFKLSKWLSQKDFVFSKAPDSVIQKRNEIFLEKFSRNPLARSTTTTKSKPRIQIVKLVDLTEDVNLQKYNQKGNNKRNDDKTKSSKPAEGTEKQARKSSAPTSDKSFVNENLKITVDKYKGKSGNEAIIKRVPLIQPKNIIKTITQTVAKSARNTIEWENPPPKKVTMSEPAFLDATRKLWQMFYEPGFTLSFTFSAAWYKRYLTHVKSHKEQLNNCVEKLLQDRQKSCRYDIIRLHPNIIESIKADFASVEITRRTTGGPFNMSCVKGIMNSQTSPLQLALQDPNNNKSVPGPNEWSPTTCDIPYQGFEGHLSWRLNEVGKTLDGLEIEMVKLRYAECMSIVFSEQSQCKQLVLSIFTAYGPDLYLYPTRVLQILKKKQIIRSPSKLHSLIQIPVDARTYVSLVPIQNHTSDSMDYGGSALGGPPAFASYMMPNPDPQIMYPQGPPFQPIPSAHNIPTHMGMNHPQFGYENSHPPHFQPPPVQYSNPTPGPPMNDFSNGYPPQRQYGNTYQGASSDSYMNQSQQADSHFMNPPHPVPPPTSQMTTNVNNSNASQKQEPVKPNALPSVLPLESWKSACMRSLAKYGPKYGIQSLSDKDYKVLYDRYLFDTFDNPDDFVRGILTGISLARYPRDDDPISTSGLLRLPSAETLSKPSLKPILKTPSTGQTTSSTISMTRADLLRVSSLLEKLIPKASPSVNANETSTPASTIRQGQQNLDDTHFYDYHHDRNERDEFDVSDFRRPRTAAPAAMPLRRNYEEEERGYEQNRREGDYDYPGSERTSSSNPINPDYYGRESGSSGKGLQAPPGGPMNPMKRPRSGYPHEDDAFQNKRMSYGEYEY